MDDLELPPQQPLYLDPPTKPNPEVPGPEAGQDDDAGLTAREAQDEIIITCLAEGMSLPATGSAAGCTSRTVSRRLEDPDFATRVSQRRGLRVAQVTGSLTSMSDDALNILRTTMAEGTTAEKLRAAQLTLNILVKLRHETELEDRLAAVEKRLPKAKKDGGAR